jgi:hypothetical protein
VAVAIELLFIICYMILKVSIEHEKDYCAFLSQSNTEQALKD